MTMHEDDESVFAALRAGALGYQLKGAAQEETLRAIRTVTRPARPSSALEIAVRLQRYLTTPPTADPADAFPQLTQRELDVLQLLAERLDNAEIAARLFLSQKTVRNYVSGILTKLQVADRAEARLVARAAGLGIVTGATRGSVTTKGLPSGAAELGKKSHRRSLFDSMSTNVRAGSCRSVSFRVVSCGRTSF